MVRCCLLYWQGQGTVDRLCIPAGDWLRAQVLHDSQCHNGALGRHFGRAKMESLVRRLAREVSDVP